MVEKHRPFPCHGHHPVTTQITTQKWVVLPGLPGPVAVVVGNALSITMVAWYGSTALFFCERKPIYIYRYLVCSVCFLLLPVRPFPSRNATKPVSHRVAPATRPAPVRHAVSSGPPPRKATTCAPCTVHRAPSLVKTALPQNRSSS